jgi:glucose-1-phosphate thymidylyltransferase
MVYTLNTLENLLQDELTQVFIIEEEFLGNDSTCLVLGDNVSHDAGFSQLLESVRTAEENKKTTALGCWVNATERCGIAEFDKNGNFYL